MENNNENETKKKILAADDNLFIRNSITFALKKEGYEVLEAENGIEAVEIAKKNKISLIFMDLLMPSMNGFDASTQIRQLPGYSDIPIVIITAHATKEHVVKGTKLGISGFLVKPFDLQELVKLVKENIS